jgi:hypothetical protein
MLYDPDMISFTAQRLCFEPYLVANDRIWFKARPDILRFKGLGSRPDPISRGYCIRTPLRLMFDGSRADLLREKQTRTLGMVERSNWVLVEIMI